MNKIETFLDLKNLLNEIPDDKLDMIGIGPNTESDCEIDILISDEQNMDIFDEYKPQLDILGNYLDGILRVNNYAVEQEGDFFDTVTIEGFITSDTVNEVDAYETASSEEDTEEEEDEDDEILEGDEMVEDNMFEEEEG